MGSRKRPRRDDAVLVGLLALSFAGYGTVVDLPRDDGAAASVGGGSTRDGGSRDRV
jgi:hypothetical protein